MHWGLASVDGCLWASSGAHVQEQHTILDEDRGHCLSHSFDHDEQCLLDGCDTVFCAEIVLADRFGDLLAIL